MITVFFTSMLAAMSTTLAYVVIIYSVDRYEREPLWLLAAAFIWGAIPSIVAALLISSGLSIPFYLISEGVGNIMSAGVFAPIVEESLKGVALLAILLFWRQELDSYLDGIIYGAMVGMGFSMVENVFYFMSTYAEEGREAWAFVVLIRAGLFGLNHALFSSMVGLGLAIARLSRSRQTRWLFGIGGWAIAVMLHAAHNIGASLGGVLLLFVVASDLGGVLITGVIVIWSLWQERRWIRIYLTEEVDAGLLTVQQHQVAMSVWRRARDGLSSLVRGGFRAYWRSMRYYQTCAELAYKKHHLSLFGHDKDRDRIGKLRQELLELGQQLPG